MAKLKTSDVKAKPVKEEKVPKNLDDLYKFVARKIRNWKFYDDAESTGLYAAYREADAACRELERKLEASVYDNPELKAAEAERDRLKKVAEKLQKVAERRLDRIFVKIKSGRQTEKAIDELVALANEIMGETNDATTPATDATDATDAAQ